MKRLHLFFVFLITLVAPVIVTSAQDLNSVRSQMAQRLPKIDEMKANGSVGENNKGFLEARGSGADQAIIAAENNDRSTVYAALAEQTNTSAAQVGRVRARQIAEQSRPGVWLQDSKGEWRRK